MRTFGLVGFPLSHSFSQKYFTEKFRKEKITDCEFRNFPLENIYDLPELITGNSNLCGLSVTIPHKQNVIKFLDEIDPAAKEIGAVNCVKIIQDRLKIKKEGYNTDVFGFESSLKPLLGSQHTSALILGTGGAAKAVSYVLKKLNIKYQSVSRSKGDITYPVLDKKVIEEHTLIINTTPLGMFPKIDEFPDIPYQFLTPQHLLYDLTYNPEETLFLKKGKEKGAQIKNGLEMLHLQADEAWNIWNQAPNP